MTIATGFGDFMFAYWWLLFPLAFFVMGGWNSYLRYKRSKAKIDLLKTYAAAGKELPSDLVSSLDKDGHDEDWAGTDSRHSRGGGTAFLVILFSGFAAIFYMESMVGWIGLEEMGQFIALVFGVLAVAFLVAGIFGRRNTRD